MFVKTVTADPIRLTAEKKEGDEASSVGDGSSEEVVEVEVVEVGVVGVSVSRTGLRGGILDRFGPGSELRVVEVSVALSFTVPAHIVSRRLLTGGGGCCSVCVSMRVGGTRPGRGWEPSFPSDFCTLILACRVNCEIVYFPSGFLVPLLAIRSAPSLPTMLQWPLTQSTRKVCPEDRIWQMVVWRRCQRST